jgi:hypothetical protein
MEAGRAGASIPHFLPHFVIYRQRFLDGRGSFPFP